MSKPVLSIDELLAAVAEHDASDLHLTAGSPPVIRVHGQLERLPDFAKLTPDDTRQLVYRILSTEQQKMLETKRQLDFSYSLPGLARFRVNAYFQRTSVGAAFRLIPARIKTLEELALPDAPLRARRQAARARARHRPDRLGQVDDARVAASTSINRTRSEHILTIEDPIEFLHWHQSCIVNQREIGAGRDVLRRGAARRAPPGPRRDPRRRDARPRDDLDRADRRRDRAPRLRDAAHPERAADDRPHHRRLSRRAAGAGARPARGDAPGRRDAEPRSRPPTAAAGWRRSRS